MGKSKYKTIRIQNKRNITIAFNMKTYIDCIGIK